MAGARTVFRSSSDGPAVISSLRFRGADFAAELQQQVRFLLRREARSTGGDYLAINNSSRQFLRVPLLLTLLVDRALPSLTNATL